MSRPLSVKRLESTNNELHLRQESVRAPRSHFHKAVESRDRTTLKIHLEMRKQQASQTGDKVSKK